MKKPFTNPTPIGEEKKLHNIDRDSFESLVMELTNPQDRKAWAYVFYQMNRIINCINEL